MGLGTAILPFLQQYMQTQQALPDPAQQPPAATAPVVGPPADSQNSPDPNAVNAHNAAIPVQQTKGHKLLQLLQGGLMGGLAGLESNAQTYAATGRNAGFGGGVSGALNNPLLPTPGGGQAPLQRQMQQGSLAQQQAQTRLTQQQGDMVQTPYGMLPVTIAKMIFPAAIKAGSAETVQGMKGQTAEKIEQSRAASQEKIHRYIAVPNVGMLDTQDPSGKPTLVPGSEQGVTINQQHLDDYNLPPEFLGKHMDLQQLAAIERASVFQNTPVMTAQGPIVVNKKTAKATPVTGAGGQTFSPPALASPLQVADPNNPGQTQIVSGGQAIAQNLPGAASASVAVPKAAAISEVPSKIGDQKVAFTTMIQHAELLRDAAKALQNGDIQTLAGLKNAFKNEFGYSGPITAKAIADAYGGEVTNVISKGHITDAEMAKTGRTLDPEKQNYETINAVLNKYQALAQSKMNMLNQQQQNAINKSQPKGKGGQTPQTSTDPFAQFGGKSR